LMRSDLKKWPWSETASFFPLLEKVSALGEPSPFLTKQWAAIQERLPRIL
jgi:hypothetical protein